MAATDPDIPSGAECRNTRQGQSGNRGGRQILEAVNGDIGLARQNHLLNLAGEKAIAPHLVQGTIGDPVPLGGNMNQFRGEAECRQQVAHMRHHVGHANLRGLRESGGLFAPPTYVYIVMLSLLLIVALTLLPLVRAQIGRASCRERV